MTRKLPLLLALTVSLALPACAPVVLAGMGAGAVVAADKVAEDQNGDEGLF